MAAADIAAAAAAKFPARGAAPAAPGAEPAAPAGEDPKLQVANDLLAAFQSGDAQALSDSLTEFYEYCKPSEM